MEDFLRCCLGIMLVGIIISMLAVGNMYTEEAGWLTGGIMLFVAGLSLIFIVAIRRR